MVIIKQIKKIILLIMLMFEWLNIIIYYNTTDE